MASLSVGLDSNLQRGHEPLRLTTERAWLQHAPGWTQLLHEGAGAPREYLHMAYTVCKTYWAAW